ncbi:hypothetical protein [Weissella halotolerans]|nr:hypothetical protein [Weissella halotolerans]
MKKKHYLPYLIFSLLLVMILLLQGGGLLSTVDPFILGLTVGSVLAWGLYLRRQKRRLIHSLQQQLNRCPYPLPALADLTALPLNLLIDFYKQPQTLRYRDLQALHTALSSLL